MSTPVRWEQVDTTSGGRLRLMYFSFDHPTPTEEGLVLRIWPGDGDNWVGNFQRSITNYSAVIEWPEASLLVIIAYGACYFVNPDRPQEYVAHSSGGIMHPPSFNDDRSVIVIADYGDLYAYNRGGNLLWRRQDLSDFEIRIESCSGDVVTAIPGDNTVENQVTIRLRCSDGRTLR